MKNTLTPTYTDECKQRIEGLIHDSAPMRNAYELYEMCKRIIRDYILSSAEYERMIRYIADEIGI